MSASPATSLKDLSIDWFKPKDPKKWYPNRGAQGIDNFGLDEIARYLAKDLRYCWYLFNRLAPKLAKRGLLGAYEFEMSLYPVIMDMEHAGFPVNKGALDWSAPSWRRSWRRSTSRCFKLAGDQFALSNTGIKRWVMFGEGDPQVGRERQRVGQPAPEAAQLHAQDTHPATQPGGLGALRRAQRDGPPAPRLVDVREAARHLRRRPRQVHHQSAADGLPTIHTSFKLHGTKTGRLSAEYPNLHQLPRGTVIRELFVAGPGHTS